MTLFSKKKSLPLCVGFLPWWPQNPYQIILRNKLRDNGLRVIGNPPLNLTKLLLKRDGLDIVHIHWPHGLYQNNYWRFPYVVFVLLLYRLLKNNIVWTIHELDFYETKRLFFDRIIRYILIKVSRSLILHSEASRAEILHRYGFDRKIYLALHPTYDGYYRKEISREAARAKLGIKYNQSVLLFFGYVKPYKGVEDLIVAFQSIKRENVVLFIVGKPLDSEIKSTIEDLARNDHRVKTRLEYIPDDDIQVYFQASDIVVFPFHSIHTSGSVMLALSFGKPLIVPRLASLPEYIDNQMAVFFDPEDENGLTKALEEALFRNIEEMELAVSNRAKSFSWEKFVSIHLEAYRETAGR